MAQLENCCGCWSLKTGTLIVGILGILLVTGGLAYNIISWDKTDDPTDRTLIKVAIGSACVSAITHGLLIYGAVKESRYFLLPWLILTGIGLGILTVLSAIAILNNPIMIIALLVYAVYWYAWACVLSYFKVLNPMTMSRPLEDDQPLPP